MRSVPSTPEPFATGPLSELAGAFERLAQLRLPAREERIEHRFVKQSSCPGDFAFVTLAIRPAPCPGWRLRCSLTEDPRIGEPLDRGLVPDSLAAFEDGLKRSLAPLALWGTELELLAMGMHPCDTRPRSFLRCALSLGARLAEAELWRPAEPLLELEPRDAQLAPHRLSSGDTPGRFEAPMSDERFVLYAL